MNLKAILIGGLTLLLLIGCASAASAPTLPAQLYGTAADANGTPLPAGTVITAELNGETFTYTLTEAGKIGGKGTFGEKLLIEPSAAGGSTEITFTANGTAAEQKVTYTSGGTTEITLVFPVTGNSSSKQPLPPESQGTATPTPTRTAAPQSTQPQSEKTPVTTTPVTTTPEPVDTTPVSEPTLQPIPTLSGNTPQIPTEQTTSPFPLAALIGGLAGAAYFLKQGRKQP